jgi:hypothetical protein
LTLTRLTLTRLTLTRLTLTRLTLTRLRLVRSVTALFRWSVWLRLRSSLGRLPLLPLALLPIVEQFFDRPAVIGPVGCNRVTGSLRLTSRLRVTAVSDR